ncbi:SRPBCC domain-containing protein [Streptomyces sp. NBC_01387]|uniref:SRPBCC domain-containing protein n=1 Tax=unclassified Streptomyces TaxID=2593676 RepID=UPI0020242175|nr:MULTISPECIES: SRPBCC domain-containing protein [unclassified Streptomyces]WSC18331.1 SRPBCC domain-containing protein [Streptomyces sp. NBC_01766]WSV52373.1 SRPBCC domain-containing protein [Streptomyces sp. NBC_01014]
MTDVLKQINAVHREIRDRPVTGGEGRSLLLRRAYAASTEDVWNACTDPSRIARWLAPVSGELRPGGTFQLEGNAAGEILRCDGPHLLKLTWSLGENRATEVEIRLSADADGNTVLELEHVSPAEVVDELVRAYGPVGPVGIGAGWDLALLSLDLFLRREGEGRGGSEGRDMASWRTTPEARELFSRSSHAWGAASQAFWGTSDEDIATVVEFAVQNFAPGGREGRTG